MKLWKLYVIVMNEPLYYQRYAETEIEAKSVLEQDLQKWFGVNNYTITDILKDESISVEEYNKQKENKG